ncbi:MAG TPA: hypothetical protein DCO75_03725 [Fibrobacteres bacterium]|nr:hypothetical protein [Fibrobacterota bacterium]
MIFKKKEFASVYVFLLLIVTGCNIPYSPKQQPSTVTNTIDTTDTSGGSVGSGVIYQVNTGQQVCNPSISLSDAFTGCMLWLGFENLSVKVPDSLSGYSLTNAQEHDRLTITDTANYVRWYMMLSDFAGRGELQGPRWSTNPDYLTCLSGVIEEPYSGFAVRISDKKKLKICNQKLEEFSIPHSWLPDSSFIAGTVDTPAFDANGFVLKEQVIKFFGTSQFKFVYSLPGNVGTLYYIDYSLSNPAPVALKKPSGKESYYCSSPQISPDGNWVTYHCYSNAAQGSYYSTYIQRLSSSSEPVFIAAKASDPHWWVNKYENSVYSIVYCCTNGSYFSEYDYTDASIESSGAAGATLIKRLKGTWADVPGFVGGLEPDNSYAADTLIKLPFKGGISPDGYFLCTAYKYAYLLRLN